jgi:Phosphoenolpyruvate carboxylase
VQVSEPLQAVPFQSLLHANRTPHFTGCGGPKPAALYACVPQSVEIVLTAHPTNVNRRTLQWKHTRIATCLQTNDRCVLGCRAFGVRALIPRANVGNGFDSIDSRALKCFAMEPRPNSRARPPVSKNPKP